MARRGPRHPPRQQHHRVHLVGAAAPGRRACRDARPAASVLHNHTPHEQRGSPWRRICRSCSTAGTPSRCCATRRSARTSIRSSPADFQNWIKEQKAWRDTAVLYDQSHHMDNLFLQGLRRHQAHLRHGDQLGGDLPGQQGEAVRARRPPSGHVIGDGILFHEAEDEYVYVGRAPAANWLMFHGETGGYANLDITVDRRSPSRPYGRRREPALLPLPDPGPGGVAGHREAQRRAARAAEVLQHVGDDRSAARNVRTLRHGMAGAPGLEVWGPYEDHDRVRDIIVEAGAEFGLVPVGSRAYPSNTLESGWIPSPLPAIYTGEAERGYREWLGADSYEATGTLAGSFVSDNIEDYYLTPWELGYGSFVKFDHDFIGRDALEKVDPATQRKQGHAGVERRGRHEDLRVAVRRRGRAATSSSTCRSRTTARRTTTRSSDAGRRRRRLLDVHRLQRQREARALARDGRPRRARGHRADGGVGRARRRHEEGRRSSRTSSSRCARWSPRCPTRRSSVRATTAAGAPGTKSPPDPSPVCPAVRGSRCAASIHALPHVVTPERRVGTLGCHDVRLRPGCRRVS